MPAGRSARRTRPRAPSPSPRERGCGPPATDHQTGAVQRCSHLVERREPDRVGIGHALSLRLGEGRALFQREGEPPAGCERRRYLLKQRAPCRETRAWSRAAAPRRTARAGAAGSARPRSDREGRRRARARSRWRSELASTPRYVQPSSRVMNRPGPADSAAQVQHGDAGARSRPDRQRPDLAGAHEALLLDELAGGVRRLRARRRAWRTERARPASWQFAMTSCRSVSQVDCQPRAPGEARLRAVRSRSPAGASVLPRCRRSRRGSRSRRRPRRRRGSWITADGHDGAWRGLPPARPAGPADWVTLARARSPSASRR